MAHSSEHLQLYSNLTDNKIGESICIRAPVITEASTYYEYSQAVQFRLDVTNQIVTKKVKWRKPKEGYGFWQFTNIQNNNTGLVTINTAHIMNGVYPHINSTHRARIGGHIMNGQLQPAGGALNIGVTKNTDGTYSVSVNNNRYVFMFDPDSLTASNANEIDFETDL
jgi:hypothetical protein